MGRRRRCASENSSQLYELPRLCFSSAPQIPTYFDEDDSSITQTMLTHMEKSHSMPSRKHIRPDSSNGSLPINFDEVDFTFPVQPRVIHLQRHLSQRSFTLSSRLQNIMPIAGIVHVCQVCRFSLSSPMMASMLRFFPQHKAALIDRKQILRYNTFCHKVGAFLMNVAKTLNRRRAGIATRR